MKKILAIALCFAMCAAVLVSCGNSNAVTTTGEAITTTEIIETTDIIETTEAIETTEPAPETTPSTTNAPESTDVEVVAVITGIEEGTDDAIAAITSVFEPLKNGAVSDISGVEDANDETKQLINSMYANFDYDITGAAFIEDDKVAVAVDITTTDFEAVLNAYLAEAMNHIDDQSWDADGAYLMEMITTPDAATGVFSAVAYVTKINDTWTVDPEAEENTDFFNALSGNAATVFESLFG